MQSFLALDEDDGDGDLDIDNRVTRRVPAFSHRC